MKYWRRSSRWRRAWRQVKTPPNRWRLYALAERMNPFHNSIQKLAYLESMRIMPGLVKLIAGTNPFVELIGSAVSKKKFSKQLGTKVLDTRLFWQ